MPDINQPPLLAPGSAGSNGILLKDIADRLFRRKRFILISFALLNVVVAGYLFILPSAYQTEIKFVVNNIRADAVVTPESDVGPVARNYVDESIVATEIQLLSSREILRNVVIKCQLAQDRRGVSVERALKDLQKELKVSPVLKANMIKASYSSPDPKEVVEVLQALADGYLNEHLRVHSSSGTYDVFDREAKHYEEQLRALQAKLNEFQQRRDIVLLGQQKDLNLRKMVDLEGALKETEAAYLENDQRVRTLKAQLTAVKPRITTQARKVPNQYSIERLNTMLVELQNRRTELLTKFKEDDRLVVQVNQQIADTKTAMDRANGLVSTEEATDVNPVMQSLETDLSKAQINATGLRARAATLTGQISEYRRSLGSLQSATSDDDQLLREIKEAEDNFFLYSKKREESRIAEAMDRQKIANVVLLEPPRMPLLADSKITLSLIAGYLLSCLIILGTAFLMSAASPKIYTPWELEALTGLPVLASYSLRSLLTSGPALVQASNQECFDE